MALGERALKGQTETDSVVTDLFAFAQAGARREFSDQKVAHPDVVLITEDELCERQYTEIAGDGMNLV